jgi:hypothetical protein
VPAFNDLSLEEEIKAMIAESPAIQGMTRAHGTSWMLLRNGVLNIYGNTAPEELAQALVPADVTQIQFARKFAVSDSTLHAIDTTILRANPTALLRTVFNGHGAFDDLTFLKHLPQLGALGVGTFHRLDLSPIAEYTRLKDLGLGGHNLNLSPLVGYEPLESFGFGDKVRDYAAISKIPNLKQLAIGGQKLRSLAFLRELAKLEKLSFSFGGTTQFEDLPALDTLVELDLWRTRMLEAEHLEPLNQIPRLTSLSLRELPRIKTLEWLQSPTLKKLLLEGMRGLRTYDSLANLPHLDALVIKTALDSQQLQSLESLGNVSTIFLYQHHIDAHAEYLSHSPLKEKISPL